MDKHEFMTTILQLNQEDLRAEVKSCFKEILEELKRNEQAVVPSDRISLQETAQITGLRKSTLYKMTMTGAIPYMKLGKRLIFSRKSILEWMETRIKSPYSPDASMDLRLISASNIQRRKRS